VDIKLDRGDRVAFVGQNGQGKTTLAKILVNKLPSTSGDIKLGHNVSVGYYAQDQSDTLHPTSTLLETMENASPPEMRTKLRNILGAFMFSGEDVDKKVSVLSGGERARLALACMLLKPFNLLVLDEPTNHLDMISKDVLKQALMNYDGTMIVVSHDREFLGDLTSRTIEFRDKQLFDHIGDVNVFLEKRAMENMRQVELEKSKSKNAPVQKIAATKTEKRELTFEEKKERKKLQRAAQNAENKISQLEEKIEQLESKMAQADFYGSADEQKVMTDYQTKKEELDTAMETWEEKVMELEEFDENH